MNAMTHLSSGTTQSPLPTIGLIVPPASGAVPQDAAILYGTRIHFVARGLGIESISPAGFAPVMHSIVDKAKELRELGAQSISLMGTSLSFYRGAAFAEELRLMMEEATGVPCTTMSHAVSSALRALQIRRVAVATAYTDELNTRLHAFLTLSGFEVTAIEGMSIDGVMEVAAVSTAELIELARTVYLRCADADGILISCGGLLTLDAIRFLEKEFGVPVVASSPCGFWDVVRISSLSPASPGYGRLFEALLA
jgi:arylmalonate decarboxylase